VLLYTDLRSAKIKDLSQDPRATILVWEQKAKLQIRMRVQIAVNSGAAVDDHWQRVPEAARIVYGSMPPPGALIDHPEQFKAHTNPDAFAVLMCHIVEIETLCLGSDLHRRAKFSNVDAWAGQWLSP
jgi:pyridoxamine 5'-phosphate oxidase